MYEVDEAQWPVLVIRMSEHLTMQDAEGYLAAIGSALQRREPFAVMIVSEQSDQNNREKGVNKFMTEWLKQHRPQLVQHCRAVAYVMTHASLLAFYKAIIRASGPRMYGCPADMFLTLDEALAWVTGKLQ